MTDQTADTTEQTAGEQVQGQEATQATDPTPPDEPRFTQADLDRTLDDRLKRDRAAREAKVLEQLGVASLDEARAALAAKREADEAAKSEAEKLAERAATAEAQAAEAQARLAAMERRLAFRAAAAAAGAPEAVLDDAWAAYPADGDVETEAVKAWLAERPHFTPAAQHPTTRGATGRGAAGQGPDRTYSDRLARWGYQ